MNWRIQKNISSRNCNVKYCVLKTCMVLAEVRVHEHC